MGAAAIPASPGLRATPLTQLENAAPKLTAYGGYVVFSRLERTGRWRLLAWHDGTISPLKVPERAVPFDADAGPAANGEPTVVFSKCSRDPTLSAEEGVDRAGRGAWNEAAGCHIYELVLPDGSPKLVRALYAAQASDTTPAIWNGDLAFARMSPGARSPVLYIWNRASRRLSRVGGGPTRCVADSHLPCNTRPRVLAWVEEMSLDGSALAYQWALPESIPAFGGVHAEIRVDPLRGTRQDKPGKVIFESITGGACNGQEGASPSVAGPRIFFSWHRSVCVGEPLESFIAAFEPATLGFRRVPARPLAVAVAQDHVTTYWIRLAEGPNRHGADAYSESCQPELSVCTLMRSEGLTGELKQG